MSNMVCTEGYFDTWEQILGLIQNAMRDGLSKVYFTNPETKKEGVVLLTKQRWIGNVATIKRIAVY